MDTLYLSVTYHSFVPTDDDNLQIPRYSSVRADHLSKTKRGVLIHYKSFLPIKLGYVKYLDEALNFELRIGRKICIFLSPYGLPSQNKDDFETFLENVELNFDHMAESCPL